MQLSETTKMMCSEDYKERFKAEYLQLASRCEGLKEMLSKWDKGELRFAPTCPRSIYNMQVDAMETYISILEARAVIEKIELEVK